MFLHSLALPLFFSLTSHSDHSAKSIFAIVCFCIFDVPS